MAKLDPVKQRQFAIDVVRRLREHGFQAYWAGGCVRDQHLHRIPYDYDVATNAEPAQICHVFHDRRTLPIGAAFGVITVVGPRGAGQIEITTFRQDAAYSDGRHPDAVTFSSPEEDAKRRDFTINGMFFDPLTEETIDYVGGLRDLADRTIRAIGTPRERFKEDKLRMLRAVRFAAIFDFEIEKNTAAAIREMAPQVTAVSAERIAAEMRIVLVHPSRTRAIALLDKLGLLTVILPEAAELDDVLFPQTVAMLGALEKPTFALALAVLLHAMQQTKAKRSVAELVGRRWKLSRAEFERAAWLVVHQTDLEGARHKAWSQVQPLLIAEGAEELIEWHRARTAIGVSDAADVEFCHQQLQRPREELDPPPLLDGGDLVEMGIARGPIFSELLHAVRVAQLDGQIRSSAEARALVRKLSTDRSSDAP